MKSLYESILSDIDDQLDLGDNLAPEIIANMPDSELRKFFNIFYPQDKPFSIYKEGGKRILKVESEVSFLAKDNYDKTLNETLGNTIDKLIYCNNVVLKDNIAKNICDEIEAPCIKIASNNIHDVKLATKSESKQSIFPNITICSGKDSAVIKNCKLEIDYALSNIGKLFFHGDVPEFINVESDTIREIHHTNASNSTFKINNAETADIWANPRWSKLFNFNYNLDVIDGRSVKTLKIKNMKNLKSIVTTRKFSENEYSTDPYTLKKDAKLSDFIDISKFKDLKTIHITDGKMGVMIFNVNKDTQTPKKFYSDMLKKDHNYDGNIFKHIPVTADGWGIIIYKR